jgi:hypothetical protein
MFCNYPNFLVKLGLYHKLLELQYSAEET